MTEYIVILSGDGLVEAAVLKLTGSTPLEIENEQLEWLEKVATQPGYSRLDPLEIQNFVKHLVMKGMVQPDENGDYVEVWDQIYQTHGELLTEMRELKSEKLEATK